MFRKSKFKIASEGKNCSNCLHSKQLPYTQEYLCVKKGVVSARYKCLSHSIDITTIATPRRHLGSFDKLSEQDFSIK